VKFNPWHDEENGRFTFAGQGRYFGGGGRGASGSWAEPRSGRREERPIGRNSPHHPKNHSLHVVQQGDTLTRIAALRKGLTASDLAWLNTQPLDSPLSVGQQVKLPHQAYLDAGRAAKNKFLALAHYMDTNGGKLPPNPADPPSLESQILDTNWRRETKDGYDFHIDVAARTRRTSGALSLAEKAARSRRNQAAAGKPDRLASDDGGHYIAARFNGPATASTISPRMRASIVEAIASWKINGPRNCAPDTRCSWISSRFTTEHRSDPTRSMSVGRSMAREAAKNSPMKRKAKPVAKDKLDILGPLLNHIGVELVDIVGGDPNGIFLYVEIGEGWISPNVFKNEGYQIRYVDDNETLSDLLWDAWYAESEEGGIKRWSIMEYEIKDGKFDVSFKYPDEVNVETISIERRQAALRARFGDKPVVYPPMPGTAVELKP
jgi:LysM repeat protein